MEKIVAKVIDIHDPRRQELLNYIEALHTEVKQGNIDICVIMTTLNNIEEDNIRTYYKGAFLEVVGLIEFLKSRILKG